MPDWCMFIACDYYVFKILARYCTSVLPLFFLAVKKGGHSSLVTKMSDINYIDKAY